MAKQIINVGTSVNSKTGDPLRTAFTKINANFAELYTSVGADVQIPSQLGSNGKFLTTNGTSLSWNNPSQLINGANIVSLDSNGTVTFPANAIFTNGTVTFNGPVILDEGSTLSAGFLSGTVGDYAVGLATFSGNSVIRVQDRFAEITINSSTDEKAWRFTSSSLTFPDNSVQTTAGVSKSFSVAMAVSMS
jgi:hypothetical protein